MGIRENNQYIAYPQECFCHLYFTGHKSTTALPSLKRLTTFWPFPYTPYYTRRTERPVIREQEYDSPDENRSNGGSDVAGQSTGSSYIIRWSTPQLMIVAVQYILTGPYISPYAPQAGN
ncbi:PREDICTED: uncharacterized protein LOC105366863 [Ceratosolen solmsi marchali]|uniref:Uncharacterized protein LOC105366863 n=1 Tax=Ceratosolen solmsi marchali TaxID=326594 RepID=A0AAJ6YT11_9HYME|nr:PREDICTED: uncharacterized protein LOC105366863 [Ceratosolen solmsi marchali]